MQISAAGYGLGELTGPGDETAGIDGINFFWSIRLLHCKWHPSSMLRYPSDSGDTRNGPKHSFLREFHIRTSEANEMNLLGATATITVQFLAADGVTPVSAFVGNGLTTPEPGTIGLALLGIGAAIYGGP